jgi:hypothetical protein
MDVSKLRVTGGVTVSGNVSASKSTKPELAGTVQITGPHIEAKHTVEATGHLTEAVEVGYVQTMVSSNRIAVYGKNGKETFRDHEQTPKSRDGRPYADVGTGARSVARPPWYDSGLSGVRSVSEGGPAELRTEDQPSFAAEAREADSVLMRTEGEESFLLSVAAKPPNGGAATPIPGGSHTWKFNWDQNIDAAGIGTGGGGISHKPAPGEVVTSEGKLAKESSRRWYDFPTKEAAMAATPEMLLRNLSLAKAAGPDGEVSLNNTVEALREKNPGFEAHVDPVSGSNDLTVTIRGTGSLMMRKDDAGPGSPVVMKFNLLSIFADPMRFVDGIEVSIAVIRSIGDGTGTHRFKSLDEMQRGADVDVARKLAPDRKYKVRIILL